MIISRLLLTLLFLVDLSQSLDDTLEDNSYGGRSYIRSGKSKDDSPQGKRDIEEIDCDIDEEDVDRRYLNEERKKLRKLLCEEEEGEEEKITEELYFEDAMNKAVQDGADEVIRSVFDSDRYLQVCAPVVLTTTLCITVRYPFPVSAPPSDGSNLRVMDQRYFELKNLVIVDADKLDPYRDLLATDEEVKKCLDDVAAETAQNEITSSPFAEGEPSVAVAVFTRRQKGESHFSFFGTRSEDQTRRISQFYPDGGKVIIYGDSNVAVGSIASQIGTLWYNCVGAPKFQNEIRWYCNGPPPAESDQEDRRTGFVSWDELDQNKVFLTKLAVIGCDSNITERLLNFAEDLRDPNAKSLQQMNVIVQHSLAHIVRQPDLFDAFEETKDYQEKCVKNTLEAMTPRSKAALADVGFELKHMAVFDGLTQHFPTETGAYTPGVHECRPGENPCASYPNWKMDQHGPMNCVGPVPKSSLFRKFLETERSQFVKNGFDMRWYGMSWQFTNLFWWQHRSWNSSNGSLDCTHSVTNGGIVSMYKYFLQAMIDDYYS